MKDSMIQTIIKYEWPLFTTTQNVGHRSPCQDEMTNFIVSRFAYWRMYSEDVLASYLHDLQEASESKKNLVTYKYGYMMQFTHPQEYAQIAHKLPPLGEQKKSLVSSIMKLYMNWEEDIAKEDPTLDNHNRPLYTHQNTPRSTSVETYMTGELYSYSEETLSKILSYFMQLAHTKINPVKQYLQTLSTY